MKRLLLSLMAAGIAVGAGIPSASAQTQTRTTRERLDARQASRAERDRLDDKADEINAMVRKQKAMDLALQRISTETGVPHERVQAMHQRHPKIGPAGVLMGNVLANETRKEPEDFMRQKARGKSWIVIARENNVPLDRLTMRLERLQNALTPLDQKQ